ncbi:MAG: DUF3231 family protein [Negativicutes bacterium]|nr:DUF3231 family protein [Negativicutes bacterium]
MSVDKKQFMHNDIRLTAGELAVLWSQYQADTMVICVLKHFGAKLEDPDIHPVLQFAIEKALNHIKVIREIFNSDKYPIPIGFNDSDVNVDAPRLFSDVFLAMYLRHMAMLGMTAGAIAVGMCARSDVSIIIMADAVELHDKARKLLLGKGLYSRSPALSTPDKVEFVSKQSFLTGFFGEKRSLTAMEIAHLFFNSSTNILGKALMMGFAQVAGSPDVKDFMQRGKNISSKHIKLLSDMLIKEDLPAPMTCESTVTDSTTAPFSDKLMMFHTNIMIAQGIGNYSGAIAVSQRRDMGLLYRLIPEIGLYAEDRLKIMIENQWMEEPPQANNRDAIVKKS